MRHINSHIIVYAEQHFGLTPNDKLPINNTESGTTLLEFSKMWRNIELKLKF